MLAPWLAADPANRARITGTAMLTSRRSGSMLSRYRSSPACSAETGA